ncbi:hypothetical protein AB0N48_18320 [Micromonospora chalcea]|uniref:hypothetical protein n=1 Tax=Micromonospora chalcea TaxID=1874 RepID=UPI0034391536
MANRPAAMPWAYRSPTPMVTGTAYAGGGAIGQQALLAEIVSLDPRDIGGRDLIAALDDLVCAAVDAAGWLPRGRRLPQRAAHVLPGPRDHRAAPRG